MYDVSYKISQRIIFFTAKMTSSRLLKIIFVILLLVTLGELGYYVYLEKKDHQKAEEVVTSRTRAILVKEDLHPGEKFVPLVQPKTIEYFKNTFIPYLEKAVYSKHKKIYMFEEEEGFAGNVKFHEDLGRLEIEFVDKEGNHITSYYTKEEFIPYKRFNKMIDGVKTPINYTDIKKGDKIRLIEYTDFINEENSYNEYLVEK